MAALDGFQPMSEPKPEPLPTSEESSPSSSWSDLLVQLIRGFVLLRDIFGYLLPGAVFLLTGSLLGQLSMFGRLSDFPGAGSHAWLLAIVLLVVSYVAGQFVVATSYLIGDVSRVLTGAWRTLTGRKRRPNEEEVQDKADFLRLHKEFPEIYVEYDRQSIIALLRRGLAASVLFGILVFDYLHTHPVRVIAAAGGIMLFNVLSGRFYIKGLERDTLKAARDAAATRKRTGT